MPASRNLTVRVSEEMLRQVEKVADREKSDKSSVARRLLEVGLGEARKKEAMEAYRSGACTVWKAAQIAGVALREMLDLLREKKIPLHITPQDVEKAWKEALEE